MKITPLLIAALSSGLLLACAQQPREPEPMPESPAPGDVRAPGTDRAATEPGPPTRPFTRETLYALLAAELAGSRERFDIALANYVQQAHQTRDPQVAARATHIARFLNAEPEALSSALLWVDISPDNTEAQLNAALALLQNGRLLEAFELSRKLHTQGEHTLFQNIAASAADSTDLQREKLLEGYLALLQEHPNHQELLVGTGLLLQHEGRPREALDYARRALEQNRDSTGGAILEASVLHQLGRTRQAIERIESALERQPHNLRLRLQYARLLTQLDLRKAQEQFEQLVLQAPNDPDLLLSLGIVAKERGDYPRARESFEALLDSGDHLSQSHYYLGQMAEQDENPDQAILHYLQVQPGKDFLSATVKLLDIFIRQDDLESAQEHMNRLRNRFPDQAEGLYLLQVRTLNQYGHLEASEALLDRALEASPDNSDLRYARAMVYDQQGRLEETLQELRTILAYDPNKAAALNALGYIMADNHMNLDEAEELIRKALALMPDDPAIMDSMGWVLYRQGKPEQALSYLEEAMAAYPDQEIAAHLGEVLWVLGERERAREIWRRGLEADPQSELIPATRQRLQVDQ